MIYTVVDKSLRLLLTNFRNEIDFHYIDLPIIRFLEKGKPAKCAKMTCLLYVGRLKSDYNRPTQG